MSEQRVKDAPLVRPQNGLQFYPELQKQERPDCTEIERILRQDLQAALGRLHSARTQLAAASLDLNGPIDSFRSAARERAAALQGLERASLRFADFVLKGIIPADLQSPVPNSRSMADTAVDRSSTTVR